MNELDQHIAIENYLKGNLSGDELTQFEANLASNPALQDEVELARLAHEVIANGEAVNIKAQLQQIHEASQSGMSANKKILIGVVVLIALALAIYLIDKVMNTDATDETVVEEVITEATESTEEEPAQTYSAPVAIERVTTTPSNESSNEEEETITEIVQLEELPQVEESNPVVEEPVVEEPIKEKVNLEPVVEEPTQDPCALAKTKTPQYELDLPCFGGGNGKLRFNDYGETNFNEFSIDGGKTFESSLQDRDLLPGKYELLAKNDDGCESKAKTITINYGKCNYVIQPSLGKKWELQLPELDDNEVRVEIRNARTGVMVFHQNIMSMDYFSWNGIDDNNQSLPMGNYVYHFSTESNGMVATGQITIVK
jgi:hypothetical protein